MLMTLRKVPPSALAAARHPASSVIGKRPPSQLLPMPELTVYVGVGHAQLSSAWIHVRAPAAAPELGIALPVWKVRAPQRQAPIGGGGGAGGGEGGGGGGDGAGGGEGEGGGGGGSWQ